MRDAKALSMALMLQTLLARCKGGVFLTVNEHRNYYQKPAEHLAELGARREPDDPIAEPEVIQGMIDADTIIELQFYPDTPICSYQIYHHDLNAALDLALSCLRE